MAAKAVILAVSIILVVGVAIGVVVGVHKSGGNKSDTSLSPQMKAISSVCGPTDFKELCMQTLSSTTNGTTSDLKELIQASISVVIDHVQSGVNLSASFLASNDPQAKWSLENCKSLYEDAMDNLQLALSAVRDGDLQTLSDTAAGIQNWLNPVVAYAVTCSDEMDDSPEKQQIQGHAENVTMVADNALAILGELSQILSAFDVKVNLASFQTGRKLLEEAATNQYPSWFSAADRKLLGKAKSPDFTIAPITADAPNAVVAQDGSGQFKSVAAALDAYPKGHKGRYIVYVKAGVYIEKYVLTKEKVNVYLYGDGPTKTIITDNKSVAKHHLHTSETATFAVQANGFIAKDIGFENTAGPEGGQAVALRVKADMCAFFNVRMDGYQDTLYVHSGLQFYRDCIVSGTVDFIFGDSSTIIQNSQLIVRKARNQNAVTAQGKASKHQTTAIVIQNCTIVPEAALVPDRFTVKSYLGRPWKKYAATIFMETEIGDLIQPEGYLSWNGDDTGYFGEYNNRGAGADTSRRVKWDGFHVMQTGKANRYTVDKYLNHPVSWVGATGIQYIPGLLTR